MEDRDNQLARIVAVVEDMHHRLFGNGQPGELADLKNRASSLEEFKNKVLGALIIIATGITVIGTALFTHLLKGN
jgi:hypothetical protein